MMVLKNVQLFGPPCMCGLLTSILYSSSYDSKFIAGARRGWIIMACTVYYNRPCGSGVARVRKWVGTEGRRASVPQGVTGGASVEGLGLEDQELSLDERGIFDVFRH